MNCSSSSSTSADYMGIAASLEWATRQLETISKIQPGQTLRQDTSLNIQLASLSEGKGVQISFLPRTSKIINRFWGVSTESEIGKLSKVVENIREYILKTSASVSNYADHCTSAYKLGAIGYELVKLADQFEKANAAITPEVLAPIIKENKGENASFTERLQTVQKEAFESLARGFEKVNAARQRLERAGGSKDTEPKEPAPVTGPSALSMPSTTSSSSSSSIPSDATSSSSPSSIPPPPPPLLPTISFSSSPSISSLQEQLAQKKQSLKTIQEEKGSEKAGKEGDSLVDALLMAIRQRRVAMREDASDHPQEEEADWS